MVWLRLVVASAALATLVAGLGWANAAGGDAIADRVYGQPGFNANITCSAIISAMQVCDPQGVVVDHSGHLYVADTQNNRVLGYLDPLNGNVADLVIGQADMTSSQCNRGVFNPAAANTLCDPGGVAVDANDNLYVADTQNNRVLEYDSPFATDTTADRVYGQPDFVERTCDLATATLPGPCHPRSVAVDGAFNMYVTDTENNRVLAFAQALTNSIADKVFGQPDFNSGQCNQGHSPLEPPAPDWLCLPIGAAVDASGNLYVGDTSNSRVLKYNVPMATDTVADEVFGQPNPNPGVCPPPSSDNLCGALGLAIDGAGNLLIAESGRSRVLVYAHAVNDGADFVFGQPNFTSSGCNRFQLSPDASTLCAPLGVASDQQGNVYVADWANNRVLEYDTPLPSFPATPTPGPPTPTTAPPTPTPAPPTPAPVGGVVEVLSGGGRGGSNQGGWGLGLAAAMVVTAGMAYAWKRARIPSS